MTFDYLDTKNRLHAIDQIRGFCLVLMVIYHFVYDITFVYNINFNFFISPAMNIIRDTFAGTFIFIAGISRNLSRNNLKSATKILIYAFIISAVTYFYGSPIIFGILHFMGVSFLISVLFIPWIKKVPPTIFYPITTFLFLLCKNIPLGYIGIKRIFSINVPSYFYSNYWLAPLGLPSRNFISYDYFPLIPWFLLFLLGMYFGRNFKTSPPDWAKNSYIPFLGVLGRHTLIVYLLHQPVVMGIVQLTFYISKLYA